MAQRRDVRWALVVVFVVCTSVGMRAQNVEKQTQEKLVGQPLYLRGMWSGNSLEFDGQGHAIGTTQIGLMTLSGVDVTDVAVKGGKMVIHANRVALVADAEGRLQRRGIFSKTLIVPSLRRGDGNKFKAQEEIRLIVHADDASIFDTALKAIFANGLAELATVAPPYWSCYAAGYFTNNVTVAEAGKIVDACVLQHGLPEVEDREGYMPPGLVGDVHVQSTREAAELGIEGTSQVHFIVGPHGVPLRFQVIRPVGAGLDEMLLQALSESTFKPATKDGIAVAADFNFSMAYSEHP